MVAGPQVVTFLLYMHIAVSYLFMEVNVERVSLADDGNDGRNFLFAIAFNSISTSY